MVQCETCKAWQHGQCMHYEAMESVPQQYFCEECEPELWGEVIRYVYACLSPSPPSNLYHDCQSMELQTHTTLIFPLSFLIPFASSPHAHGGDRPPNVPLSFPSGVQDDKTTEYDE